MSRGIANLLLVFYWTINAVGHDVQCRVRTKTVLNEHIGISTGTEQVQYPGKRNRGSSVPKGVYRESAVGIQFSFSLDRSVR